MSVLLCSQCPDALASGRQMEWCYPPVHWGRGRVGQPCAAESGGLPMRGRLIDTIRYDLVDLRTAVHHSEVTCLAR